MKKSLLFFGFFITVIIFLRLFTVLGTNGLSDDISYDVLRQIDSIKQTGLPLFEDSQSYLGSQRVFNPALYYVLVPFSFGDTIANMQILLQFFFVISVVLIFFICQELGIKKRYSYIGATLWAVIPISTIMNLNSLSPVVLLTPIVLLWIYVYIIWVKNQNSKSFVLLLFVQIVLIGLHPIGLVSLLAMLVALVYTKIDQRIIVRKEKELMLFLLLFGIGIYYFLYYQAFLFHGFAFFSQQGLTSPMLSLSEMIILASQLGIILLPLALYSLIIYTQHQNIALRFSSRLIASLMGVVLILSVLQFFSFQVMFYLISLCSTILVSLLLQHTADNIEKTKLKKVLYNVFTISIVFVLLTFASSSLFYANGVKSLVPSQELKSVLDNANSLDDNAIIIAPTSVAFTTMYYSGKKTFMDTDSLLKSNIKNRQALLESSYSSSFLTPLLKGYELYDANRTNLHILFLDTQKPVYISSSCVNQITNHSDISLYWIGCEDS